MSSVFISHSSQDKAAALKIKDWLEQHGHRSLFLDFDPEAGIKAGSRWEATLFEKLRRCQALVALVSVNWTRSKWCFAELVQARELGKLVVMARIGPHDDNAFTDLQQIDLSNGAAEEYRKLEIVLANVFDWNPSRSPYPGLLAFQEADAAVFFGRGDEIDQSLELLERLRHHRRTGPRFLLMLGASGSGKSSIVRAGLIPRLKRSPERWFSSITLQPREQPLTELALALAHGRDQTSWQSILQRLEHDSASDPPVGAALGDMVRSRLAEAGQPDATMLLVIDQAEELFVTSRVDAARSFLYLIRCALDNADGRLMVLATMRSEFLGAFQTHPFLTDPCCGEPLRYEQLSIDPLPYSQFKTVITGPARLAGLSIEDDLVETLVRDTVSGDALPLLAFTLRRLWEQACARGDSRLALSEYQRIGGLAGAIETAADEALDSIHPSADMVDALAAAFVPGLVRVNADGLRVRRLALRDDLPVEANALLARFVDARLLVTDRDENGAETLEVAHEALLGVWTRLRRWIDADQDNLRLLEALRRAAKEWYRSESREDLLIHRDGRLTDVLSISHQPRFTAVIDQLTWDYLRSCEQAQQAREEARRDREQRRLHDAERIAREQRGKLQRTYVGLGVAIVLLFAVALAAWQAILATKEANLQESRAVALLLAAQGELLVQTGDREDAKLGALLVVESLRRLPDTLSGERALASVVSYFPPLVRELSYTKVERSNSGAPLAFSWDGRYFAAADNGKTTRIWLLDSGELLHEIAHDAKIKALGFSHNGELLATAGYGDSVDVWRTQTGKPFREIPANHPTQAVVFSGNDELLAVARDQGSDNVYIYRVFDGELWKSVDHLTGDVVAMDFDHSGRFLLTAGYHSQIEENVTQIWDLKTGGRTTRDNYLDSNAVAYSYDGELAAAGGYDGRVQIWKLSESDDQEEQSLDRVVYAERPFSGIQSLEFSPDDTVLAIAAVEPVLWDFRSNREVGLIDHQMAMKIAYLDNGRYLGTAGGDLMRLWHLGRGRELEESLRTNRAPVLGDELTALLSAVCRRIGRTLSEDEWRRFVPDEPLPNPCAPG